MSLTCNQMQDMLVLLYYLKRYICWLEDNAVSIYEACTTEELRAYCRTTIESLELWGRRLINDLMVPEYGEDYLHATLPNGEGLIKAERLRRLEKRRHDEPHRYLRWVDTLFLDDIRYILCKQMFYDKLFKPALDHVYKQGKDEADFYLQAIEPVRNNLSHANPISIRQAEKAICYSHDFIDGIQEYYKEIGRERMWNVPTILKMTDSLGNQFTQRNNQMEHVFYVGDSYALDAEIDSSFSPDEYDISWIRRSGHPFAESSNDPRFRITFKDEDVNQCLSIRCLITSKKNWHKYDYCDDQMSVNLCVLPREAID